MKFSALYSNSLLACLFISNVGYSIENLTNEDLVGCWHAKPPITHGETTTLMIDGNHQVTLRRNFGKSERVIKSNGDIHFFEDFIISKLNIEGYNDYYKLVASGWKSHDEQSLFGMLYMYNENTLFNGLPFQFKKIACAKKI